MARDLLHDGDGALADQRDRHRVVRPFNFTSGASPSGTGEARAPFVAFPEARDPEPFESITVRVRVSLIVATHIHDIQTRSPSTPLR